MSIEHGATLLTVIAIFATIVYCGRKIFERLLEHHREITAIQSEAIRKAAVEAAQAISNGIVESISGTVNTFGKDYILATKTMNTSLSDHMNALNQLLSTEFYNAILLPRAGTKDKPPIDDIKATTDMIANRILSGLEPEFFTIFKIHGMSEEFIMSYITRELFTKLIEFTRNNRKKDTL